MTRLRENPDPLVRCHPPPYQFDTPPPPRGAASRTAIISGPKQPRAFLASALSGALRLDAERPHSASPLTSSVQLGLRILIGPKAAAGARPPPSLPGVVKPLQPECLLRCTVRGLRQPANVCYARPRSRSNYSLTSGLPPGAGEGPGVRIFRVFARQQGLSFTAAR
jgi:hypothetical protein